MSTQAVSDGGSKGLWGSLYDNVFHRNGSSKTKHTKNPSCQTAKKMPRPTATTTTTTTTTQSYRLPTREEFEAQLDRGIAARIRVEQIEKEKVKVQAELQGLYADKERLGVEIAEATKTFNTATTELINKMEIVISLCGKEMEDLNDHLQVGNKIHERIANNLLWFVQEATEIKGLVERDVDFEDQRTISLDNDLKDFCSYYFPLKSNIIAGSV